MFSQTKQERIHLNQYSFIMDLKYSVGQERISLKLFVRLSSIIKNTYGFEGGGGATPMILRRKNLQLNSHDFWGEIIDCTLLK